MVIQHRQCCKSRLLRLLQKRSKTYSLQMQKPNIGVDKCKPLYALSYSQYKTSNLAIAARPREACFFFDQSPALFAKSQNCIFEPPYGGNMHQHQGNINAISESFNSKKHSCYRENCSYIRKNSAVALVEPPFGGLRANLCDSSLARWKARS